MKPYPRNSKTLAAKEKVFNYRFSFSRGYTGTTQLFNSEGAVQNITCIHVYMYKRVCPTISPELKGFVNDKTTKYLYIVITVKLLHAGVVKKR